MQVKQVCDFASRLSSAKAEEWRSMELPLRDAIEVVSCWAKPRSQFGQVAAAGRSTGHYGALQGTASTEEGP